MHPLSFVKFILFLLAGKIGKAHDVSKSISTSFQRWNVENYPDFESLAHVIQHGLQGFLVKNIEDESTEGKWSQSYFVEVGLLHK